MAHTAYDGAMARAIELAVRGPRGVNPQVGAVILSPAGDVLAEGWHRGAGTAHAEIDALRRMPDGAARGATAVVTLEPCNHTGRTGPCARALIEAGVARVVYAIDDPGPRSGGGAERLRHAGVEVVSGVEAEAARDLLDSWLVAHRLGRPHVSVKWAQSLDGRAAADDGSSQWITGEIARHDVHLRRALADVIVVGIGTVLADDPALTARRPDGTAFESQPQPLVLGRRDVPADARLRSHPRGMLQEDGHDLRAVLAGLHAQGVHRVFVEGGPRIASAFLDAGLVDTVLAYVAPVLLGGRKVAIGDIGVPSMSSARRLRLDRLERLGDDVLFVASPIAATVAADADQTTARTGGED